MTFLLAFENRGLESCNMRLRYLCHITTLLTTAELLLRRDVRAHPRGVRVRARVPTGAAPDARFHRHHGMGFGKCNCQSN